VNFVFHYANGHLENSTQAGCRISNSWEQAERALQAPVHKPTFPLATSRKSCLGQTRRRRLPRGNWGSPFRLQPSRSTRLLHDDEGDSACATAVGARQTARCYDTLGQTFPKWRPLPPRYLPGGPGRQIRFAGGAAEICARNTLGLRSRRTAARDPNPRERLWIGPHPL
jgi:hypothetical protein